MTPTGSQYTNTHPPEPSVNSKPKASYEVERKEKTEEEVEIISESSSEAKTIDPDDPLNITVHDNIQEIIFNSTQKHLSSK